MSDRNFHAIPHPTGWALYRTGAKRASLTYLDRDRAWHEARRRARAQGLVAYLHDTTGRIVARNNYGVVA